MSKNPNSVKTANLNIRLHPIVKNEAERIFNYHGLTLSDAVAVFINHACHAGGFPFDLKNAPYTDPDSIEALHEAKKLINDPNAKTYNNVKELFADCLNDDINDN